MTASRVTNVRIARSRMASGFRSTLASSADNRHHPHHSTLTGNATEEDPKDKSFARRETGRLEFGANAFSTALYGPAYRKH